MKFYGFDYWDSKKTTTGTSNEKTGRMSIAGTLNMFSDTSTRDKWVDDASSRESVLVKDVRSLFLGMSIDDFKQMLENMLPVDKDGLFV